MDTLPTNFPEQNYIMRRGSRSPTATAEELERRALLLKNDLLLHEAVIKNDPESVKRILREPLDVNSRNNYGRAPIHWAASRGSTDIMEMLIAAKCDIEAKDKYGMRPILMSAWHGHVEGVKILVNAGALTNALNKKQYTLLICAAHNNRLSVVNFLLDTLEDVNIDAADQDSQTALYHSAIGGHTAVLKRLIEAGANPDCRDKEARTALHAACEHGHLEVAEYLLAHEADMEASDSSQNTPLHLASEQQQTSLVQLLLDHGADPDAENFKGFTPLHIACNLGSRGIIDSLIQHGACLNKQSKNGSTPLHMACQANEVETVELLIAKGADFNCLNNRLQSPMHIAAEMGHTDICKLLLAAGANIEQREQSGKTPLYIAARGSFTAIVDMIIKTARLDYPAPSEYTCAVVGSQEEQRSENKRKNSLKPVLNTARRKLRMTREESKGMENNERLRQVLYKLAYKQLSPGEWKRLAYHWAFTDEQIKAIEHQYTGPASYKEHGFRMMLIWIHGLSPDVNPVKELCESLTAIDKKAVADALRRKIDQENEEKYKGNKQKCASCSIT